MDLNGDGNIDILSGSYSRMENDMAGLFQVLYGAKDGTFAKPTAVLGTDGEPLIIDTDGSEGDVDIGRICTRPTAVDIDGDGNLDIVTGNFGGTFAVFWGGAEGFDPLSSMLTNTKGKNLHVAHHSDPTFADWDGDGDLDLISGSDGGGVVMFPNVGSKTEPSFGKSVTLVKPAPEPNWGGPTQFGDDHIQGPGRSTRVSVADVNGDGKHDLLIGDAASINTPAEGLSIEECRKRMAEWEKEMQAIQKDMPRFESQEDWENMTDEETKAFEAAQEKMMKHYDKRATFINERSTGFVWLLIQE